MNTLEGRTDRKETLPYEMPSLRKAGALVQRADLIDGRPHHLHVQLEAGGGGSPLSFRVEIKGKPNIDFRKGVMYHRPRSYRPTDQARPCLTKGDWREGAVAFPETHQTLS